MIVIGIDPHKDTHSAAPAEARTARHLTEITISARPAGLRELLNWAQELDVERMWVIEDCRHVSGALERMLLAAGERVVRVAPKLMANQRKAARQRGKSDAIDALAIARAAIRELDLPPGLRDRLARPHTQPGPRLRHHRLRRCPIAGLTRSRRHRS